MFRSEFEKKKQSFEEKLESLKREYKDILYECEPKYMAYVVDDDVYYRNKAHEENVKKALEKRGAKWLDLSKTL